MALAGTAYINFEGDFGGLTRQAKGAGGRAADEFGGQFKRDLNGKLRDSRGRFAAEGKESGSLFSRGFTRNSDIKKGFKGFAFFKGDAARAGGESGSAFRDSFKRNIARAGGLAAVAGGGFVVKKGFDRLLGLEEADRRLETMGVSAGDADKLMGSLNKTLEGTPYSLDAGATAMTGFVSSGMDISQIPKTMGLLTDAAGFSGASLGEVADIFQDVTLNGKASTDVIQELQTRGVPAASLLSSALGLTGAEFSTFVSEGKLDSATFFSAWEKGAKGFGDNNIKMTGSAKSAGEGVKGSFGNMITALARGGAEVLGPLFERLPGLFKRVSDGVDRMVKAFDMDGLAGVWALVGPKLGDLLTSLGNWITGTALPWLVTKLGEWGSALWGWIQPQIMPMLTKLWELLGVLGDWVTGTALPWLWTKLGEWGSALWGWIQPQILPMIGKLGELLAAIRTWATDVAFPALVAKLGEWGKALWAWVEPQIGPTLMKLGLLLAGIGAWIIAVGLPWLILKLSEWAYAFSDWVVTSAMPWLNTKISELLTWLGNWIAFTALPWITLKLLEWAKAFGNWITETALPWLGTKIAELLAWFGNWITFTALPWIIGKLMEWGKAFGDFVTETALPWLVTKIGELLTWLGGWMKDTALPAIIAKLKDWGLQFGQFLVDAIPWMIEKAGELLSSLSTWFTKTALPGIKTKLFEFAGTIGGGIAGVISSAFDSVPGAISGVLRSAGNLIAGFLRGAAGIADKVGLGPVAKALRSGADAADGWGESGGHKYSQGVRDKSLLARGGSVPPFVTDGPRAIVGEGRRRWPEYVIPTDPKYRGRAQGLWHEAGTQLLAGGGVMGRNEVGTLGKKAGFGFSDLVTAVAVAQAESGFNPNARNVNSNGTIDRGLWQINSIHGALSTFDPQGNANAAHSISSGGSNWRPWVAYKSGAYKKFLYGGEGGPLGMGTGGGGVDLGFSPQDATLGAMRDLAAGSLERLWHKMDVPNGLLGLVPGGHNYLRQFAIDKIKGESASREKFLAATVAHASLGGGEFARSGGGGPAGNYTAAMLRARSDVLGKFGQMSVGGYANRNVQGTGKLSDHARYRAWDFMVGSNRGKGNSIASHLLSKSGDYGLKYLIWYDQINSGGGWRPYSHPGNPGGTNPTLAHRDHVHASFMKDGGVMPVSAHARNFDSGGTLNTGWNMVRNDTGAPEQLAPTGGRGPLVGTVVTRSPEDIDMLVRRMAFSLGGVG